MGCDHYSQCMERSYHEWNSQYYGKVLLYFILSSSFMRRPLPNVKYSWACMMGNLTKPSKVLWFVCADATKNEAYGTHAKIDSIQIFSTTKTVHAISDHLFQVTVTLKTHHWTQF